MNIDTTGRIRVLGISGSLRTDSVNTALLRAAADLAGPDITIDLWAGLAAIPPFNEDEEHQTPAAVHDMRAAIAGAQVLLVSTPEYNGSLPGQLKNALDWASRPYGDSVLTGKLAVAIGASPGDYGAAWAVGDLRKVLSTAGATVLERELCLPLADQAFDPAGQLKDLEKRAALSELVDSFRTVLVSCGQGAVQ